MWLTSIKQQFHLQKSLWKASDEIWRLEKQIEYEKALINKDFAFKFPLQTQPMEESDNFSNIKPSKAPFYYGKSLGECKMWLTSIKQQFHLQKSLQKAFDEIWIDWASSHFHDKPQINWQTMEIEEENRSTLWNEFEVWCKNDIESEIT